MSSAVPYPLRVTAAAECVATAFLVMAVVGSGIAAERLCMGNVGLALLANALATTAALFVLILVFAPISGAHMNPCVTFTTAIAGDFAWAAVPAYVIAQVAGAIFGTALANTMFELPLWEWSTHVRTGAGQWLAETIATIGLLGVIWGSMKQGTVVVAGAVAAYIGGAYWFTSSTSFANPAVTIARAFTNSFSGIRPADVAGFIAAQAVGVVIFVIGLRVFSSREILKRQTPHST